MPPHPIRALALAMPALAASAAMAGDRLVATVDVADFDVVTTESVTIPATFADLDPGTTISGIGLTARYTGVRRDNKDGLGPWSLDVRVTAHAPTGETLAWNPIGGDVTIADYPFQDATPGLPGVAPGGVWEFVFDSVQPLSVWTYGLRDVRLHLLTDAPDVVTQTEATPDPQQTWDRPFFIEGVSGLGPVAYHADTFTVSESGRYVLESVLPSEADHFPCLYRGDFDASEPLENLLDYGLGNGFSPFGVPRGTSRIEALLIAGESYTWVTSQWAATSAIQTASNTVTGPGQPVTIDDCPADFNGDGSVNVLDVVDFITNWNASGPGSDFNDDGSVNVLDVVDFITNWNAGCP